MWKHEIIQEAERNFKGHENEITKLVTLNLKKSVPFYFGDDKYIYDFTRLYRKTLQSSEVIEGAKLMPYPTCLFEYKSSFSRPPLDNLFMALLLSYVPQGALGDLEADGHLIEGLVTFFFFGNGNKWEMVEGFLVITHDFDFKCFALGDSLRRRHTQDETVNHWRDTSDLFMRSLHLMNTKGVSIESVLPNKKQNEKRVKNGKLPLYSYKVLRICPQSSKNNSEKGFILGIDKLPARYHGVRLHVKNYKPEAPLFGKFVGSVICPSHFRGDKRRGVVDKEYHVKTKQAEA